MNDAWIEGRKYCTVQFRQGDGWGCTGVSVLPGTILSAEVLGISEEEWKAIQNRTEVDLSKPITQDIFLERFVGYEASVDSDDAELISSEENTFATQDYIALASVVVLAVFFMILTLISFRNSFTERREIHEHSGTEISP